MTYTSKAFAKINLSLDIVSKMDDGYHDLEMVMQSVSLYDEITIKCAAGEGVSVKTNLPYLPRNEKNIAVKAALAFFCNTGITGYSAHIEVNKNIPVCAGLGGGSADAACVLRMLDMMFKTHLGRSNLEKLGSTIGSDIPFCIDGGTKLAKGRGEILTDLPPIPHCDIVICKPSFSCSTPELYGLIQCEKIRSRPDTDGLLKAIDEGDLCGVARRMYNVFEDVVPHGKPEIDEIKCILLDNSALGAVMTGSGPTVFGLFNSETNARNAYNDLKTIYAECYLTNTICAGQPV
ncbi:MAG: 4-(cytidine 5'-diphospho)-2-C-methyl-D-erythritol kinase [Oscillospiraceae bacterium]|jgi:4-diphosphocytidyl-2-C-methyl-D-erythritol kinase|nr:4-(cytidine 5'-diphospho)-2-C-methyl-D-erythritol kinase [Oscillospiraceae bacterium]